MTGKKLKKANEIQNEINKLENEIRTLKFNKSIFGNMIWESNHPPTKIVVITSEDINYLINCRVEKAEKLKKLLKEL